MKKTLNPKGSVFKKIANVQNLYRLENGNYYILVKRGGRQIRRSLRTKDFNLAKRRLRDFQDKAGRLNHGSEYKQLAFEELAERWINLIRPTMKASSHLRRSVCVNSLLPYFKGTLVSRIGISQIEAWQSSRSQQISPRTWNLESETLQLIMDYAKNDLCIILENPADKAKRRKLQTPERRIPTKAEFTRLIEELRNGHKAGEAANLMEFLAYSGCRLAEAMGVEWRHVDFDKGSILITGGEKGTKNHEHRTIHLFDPLRRFLEGMKAKAANFDPNAHIFKISSARMAAERACDRLGLPRYGHHSMRHFFCSNCIEAGVDFKTIAHWLGHKDGGILVAKTYGHLRQEHSDAMAKRITFDATASSIAEPNKEVEGD